MKKVTKIIIMFILLVLALITISNAAGEAKLTISASATTVKPGDEIEVAISVTNNSISKGIGVIMGAIEMSSEDFQLVTLDYDEEIAKATGLMPTILNGMKEKINKLLYVDNNWIMGAVEESGAEGLMAITITDAIPEATQNKEIGKIKIKVLDSAKEEKTEIKISNINVAPFDVGTLSSVDEVNTDTIETIEIEEATTGNITISRGTSSGGMQEIRSLDPEEETPKATTAGANNGSSTGAASNAGSAGTQAKTNTPYTGVEDVIPFIVVSAIIGLFGYMRYRKYKGI